MGYLDRIILRSCGGRLTQRVLAWSSTSSVFCLRQPNSPLSWSCRAMSSSSSPCLVLPPDFKGGHQADDDREGEKGECYYSYYSVEEKRVLGVKVDNVNEELFPWEIDYLLPMDACCIGSSHGWLAYHSPRANNGSSLRLFRHPPLSYSLGSSMYPLPPIQTHPRISSVIINNFGIAAAAKARHDDPIYCRPSLFIPPPHKKHERAPRHPRSPDSDASDDDKDEQQEEEEKSRITSHPCLKGPGSDIDDEHDLKVRFHQSNKQITRPTPFDFVAEMDITKLVLSSPPQSPSISSLPCTVLAIIDASELAFCKLGDSQWTALDALPRGFDSYGDIIFSPKDMCFYATCASADSCWHLQSIDFTADPSSSSPKTTVFHPEPPPRVLAKKSESKARGNGMDDENKYQYLVECAGEILMIRGFIPPLIRKCRGRRRRNSTRNNNIRFDVFKLDGGKSSWKSVECIGDHALFIGLNHSFSLSTRSFPGLKPNSIYFAETKSCHPLDYTGTQQNIGIFDIQYNNIVQHLECCPGSGKNAEFIYPPPIWVAPIS